jgi:hypothetical protein
MCVDSLKIVASVGLQAAHQAVFLPFNDNYEIIGASSLHQSVASFVYIYGLQYTLTIAPSPSIFFSILLRCQVLV